MKVNKSPSNNKSERPVVAFYPLKPSGHLMYHQVNHSKNPAFYPHRVFVCFVLI